MRKKYVRKRPFAPRAKPSPPTYGCANVDLRTLRAGVEVESQRAMALYAELMAPVRLKAVA